MASRATITNPNESALAMYTQPTPPVVAIRMPARDGPATDAVCIIVVLRLMAFGRCSRGTSVGTSACRAGRSNALTAEANAASAYTGHGPVKPRKVNTASTSGHERGTQSA